MSKGQNNAASGAAKNLGTGSTAAFGPYVAQQQGAQGNTQSSQQMPAFQGAFGGYSGDLSTGGFNPSDYAGTLSGYNNMATTGGFDPAQSNAYMDQATSGVTNTYNVLKEQAERNKAKTGGMGGSGEIAQIARQLGQAQSSAEQGAAVNLNIMKNQNKMAGLSGSAGLQGQQAGNKLSAAGGLANMYNTATGEFTDQGKQILAAMGINWQNQTASLDALTKLATSEYSAPTWYGTALKGAAQGAATGLGMMAAG